MAEINNNNLGDTSGADFQFLDDDQFIVFDDDEVTSTARSTPPSSTPTRTVTTIRLLPPFEKLKESEHELVDIATWNIAHIRDQLAEGVLWYLLGEVRDSWEQED